MQQSKVELKNIDDWDYDFIEKLVKEQEKESIHLEYKAGKWLENKESGKFRLRKWVTSFANSAGGFFVIGVPDKEINNERLPDTPDGIEKNKFGEDNAKWIEDVILNSIFPHLNPVPRIKPIAIPNTNREIVVLCIPQTIAVLHKITYNGRDKYFHRHEFQVIEMNEWEIRALLFGRKPPPVLELIWAKEFSILCVLEEFEGGRRITNNHLTLKLVNNGLGFGKNIQTSIICPMDHEFELFEPRYEEVGERFTSRNTPVRYKREAIPVGILSPQIEKRFDIQLFPPQYHVIKIYEKFLHAGDSINYAFNLRVRDFQVRDYKDSDEIRVKLGIYCLSEESQIRCFGMDIKINKFYQNNAELEVEIEEYSEDKKIPISISATFL